MGRGINPDHNQWRSATPGMKILFKGPQNKYVFSLTEKHKYPESDVEASPFESVRIGSAAY